MKIAVARIKPILGAVGEEIDFALREFEILFRSEYAGEING